MVAATQSGTCKTSLNSSMMLVTGRLRGRLAWLKMDPNFFTALARERSCLLGTPGSCNTCDKKMCSQKTRVLQQTTEQTY